MKQMTVVALLMAVLTGCNLLDPYRNVTDPIELNHAAILVAEKGKVNKKSLIQMLNLEQRALKYDNRREVPGGDVLGTAVYPTCGDQPFVFIEPRKDPAPFTYRELRDLLEENIDSVKKSIDSCNREESLHDR